MFFSLLDQRSFQTSTVVSGISQHPRSVVNGSRFRMRRWPRGSGDQLTTVVVHEPDLAFVNRLPAFDYPELLAGRLLQREQLINFLSDIHIAGHFQLAAHERLHAVNLIVDHCQEQVRPGGL